MPAARWRKFGKHSGLVIRGTVPVALPEGAAAQLHTERAFYLVSQLESSRWGSVQSYDGAGMSGGPLHNIACYKAKGTQGSLFGLIGALKKNVEASAALDALLDAFDQEGWKLTAKGQLRAKDGGALVSGTTLVDVFAPPAGKVPEARGPERTQAARWARLFHAVFADPATFDAQKAFAIGTLLRGQRALESRLYEGVVGEPVDPERLRVSEDDGWSEANDLAACVYHAHSVNAPAIARKCLEQALDRQSPASDAFAGVLIHALGRRKYGRWRDTADGKNRYDKTRKAAMKSKLWSAGLFAADGIMPQDLQATPPVVKPAAPPVIATGAEGPAVEDLQERLAALDYNPGEIDGDFAGLTRRALERFQHDHVLRATGTLTAATRRALASSPGRAARIARPAVSTSAIHRVEGFVRRPLRTARYELQREALAAYHAECQDEPVDFAERLARTAEWFHGLGVAEQGSNTGRWVDFIRVTGGGPHRPSTYPPWCAFFVSACLRITNWVGDYGLTPKTSGGATRLYLGAPKSLRIERDAISELDDKRGSIFVRTRTSKPVSERTRVLRGAARKGHTGIVVGTEDDGSLLCIAGNSSGAGHSRVSGSGAVAYELIGPATGHGRKAFDRLVGLVRYQAEPADPDADDVA